MTMETWRRFYAERDYDRCAYLEGEDMVAYAEAFFEAVGVPDSMASVGCGPAVTEFALAERYPDTRFRCFDVAERVVEDNRDLACTRGLENLSFQVAALPDADLDGRFDVVYCVATLYFVREVERALLTLFDHVAPGGHLVVSYPDEQLRSWVREQDDRKRRFFGPVEAGENVLTEREVERILNAEVQDYWALRPEESDGSATVYARKPPAAGE